MPRVGFLVRGGFFSPSPDGGLPLLPLFSPRRRSNSATRAIKVATVWRNVSFSARKRAISAAADLATS